MFDTACCCETRGGSSPARPSDCGGGNREVTLPQVRRAAEALIDARPLPTAVRRSRLTIAANTIQYRQHHNAAARISHTQTRLQLLKQLDIPPTTIPNADPDNITTCVVVLKNPSKNRFVNQAV